MSEIEADKARIRSLEKSLAQIKGGFVVGSIFLMVLGAFGYVSWMQIPSRALAIVEETMPDEANKQVQSWLETNTPDLLRRLEEEQRTALEKLILRRAELERSLELQTEALRGVEKRLAETLSRLEENAEESLSTIRAEADKVSERAREQLGVITETATRATEAEQAIESLAQKAQMASEEARVHLDRLATGEKATFENLHASSVLQAPIHQSGLAFFHGGKGRGKCNSEIHHGNISVRIDARPAIYICAERGWASVEATMD